MPDPAAVVLDFYGTLARATEWVSIPEVLGDRGVTVSEAALRRYFDGHDGAEHVEHSASRDAYVAWQRHRMLAMLAETDVHPGEHEAILAELRAGTATRVLERYPEVVPVLGALRARGIALAICSNWDWDLTEAVAESGLAGTCDVVVSSAWAGARKPHPRIYTDTLARLERPADTCWFVGDTWAPDVEGPTTFGFGRCLYLERAGHWPDPGAPAAPADRAAAATCIADLTGILDLLDGLDATRRDPEPTRATNGVRGPQTDRSTR